jgi:hypothetical protein
MTLPNCFTEFENANLKEDTMSTEVLDASPAPTSLEQPKCHAIHVKEVPYAIWCRVRHNANLSRMTVREYVIQILASASPCNSLATGQS